MFLELSFGKVNKVLIVVFEGGPVSVEVELFDFLGVSAAVFGMFMAFWWVVVGCDAFVQTRVFFLFLHESLDLSQQFLLLFF